MADLQASGLDIIMSAPLPDFGRELPGIEACGSDRAVQVLSVADALLSSFNIRVDNQLDKYSEVPQQYELYQNYPNPFNPITTIRYGLPEAADVKIMVYNVLGRKVATLVNDHRQAGFHKALWDSKSHQGIEVSSGVYFYRIEANDFIDVKKMVLLR